MTTEDKNNPGLSMPLGIQRGGRCGGLDGEEDVVVVAG
jgi:hypothetical protein